MKKVICRWPRLSCVYRILARSRPRHAWQCILFSGLILAAIGISLWVTGALKSQAMLKEHPCPPKATCPMCGDQCVETEGNKGSIWYMCSVPGCCTGSPSLVVAICNGFDDGNTLAIVGVIFTALSAGCVLASCRAYFYDKPGPPPGPPPPSPSRFPRRYPPASPFRYPPPGPPPGPAPEALEADKEADARAAVRRLFRIQ